MEDLFKRNLLTLRKPVTPQTFGEALLSPGWWKPSELKRPMTKKVKIDDSYSEKVQMIESLERFAQEKIQESASPVIKLDGGEIVLKAEPTWNVSLAQDSQTLIQSLSLEPEILEILLSKKFAGAVKVLFVAENFRSYSDVKPDLKSGMINEILAGFPLKTAEFFERMIVAMKLSSSEIILYPVENQEQDLSDQVMSIAAFYKPEVIITLGAKASQKILKSQERLSLLHGQFFKRTIEGAGSFQVVPLYHPSIIETNLAMKKTAWADMQKIMVHLKKLS